MKILGPEEVGIDSARASTPPKDEVPTGEEIRAARRAARMTQASLAVRMGVSQRMISALETGEKQVPRDRFVRMLAVLGQHLDR